MIDLKNLLVDRRWSNGDLIDVSMVPATTKVRIVLPGPITPRRQQQYEAENGGAFLATYRYRCVASNEEFVYVYDLENIEEVMPPRTPQTDFALGDAARLRLPWTQDEADLRRKEWRELLAPR